jgi:hypothetical protein
MRLNKGTYLKSQYSRNPLIITLFFFSNAPTCPLWTLRPLLPVVAEVQPTSEVGKPMRPSYVIPMKWVVIHEYEVPGGALT